MFEMFPSMFGGGYLSNEPPDMSLTNQPGHRSPIRSILMEADCFDCMASDVNFLKN